MRRRKNKNLSQGDKVKVLVDYYEGNSKQFAEAMGVRPTFISEIVRGTRSVRTDKLRTRIGNVLGMSLEDVSAILDSEGITRDQIFCRLLGPKGYKIK